MKTLTAVLLAGGESRRMGTDKAALIINGEPLWSRQLRLLRELEPQQIIVSARSRPAWCSPEIDVVLDAKPSRGPLSGLAAALEAITTTHALILAMDLPLIEGDFLRRLWVACEMESGAVPIHGDFFEPLCAIYPASASDTVNAALDSDNYSLHGAINELRSRQLVRTIPIPSVDRRTFLNLNSPAELSALQARAQAIKGDPVL